MSAPDPKDLPALLAERVSAADIDGVARLDLWQKRRGLARDFWSDGPLAPEPFNGFLDPSLARGRDR